MADVTLTSPKTDWESGDAVPESELNNIGEWLTALGQGAWIEQSGLSFHESSPSVWPMIAGLQITGDYRSIISKKSVFRIYGVFDDGASGVVNYAYAIINYITYSSVSGITYFRCTWRLPGAAEENIAPVETDTFTTFYYAAGGVTPADMPSIKRYWVTTNLGFSGSMLNLIDFINYINTSSGNAVYTFNDVSASLSTGIPLGAETYFVQMGSNKITIAEGSDILIHNVDEEYSTSGQYAIVGLKKIAEGEYLFFGRTGA